MTHHTNTCAGCRAQEVCVEDPDHDIPPCPKVMESLSRSLMSAAREALILHGNYKFAMYLEALADDVWPELPF